MSPDLLFKTGPYVSIACFALGMALRYRFSRQRPATDAGAASGAGSPGRTLLRIGLGLLLVGHLAGLLAPRWILIWNAVPARLYLLESIAFASGAAALFGWAVLAFRHLARPVMSAAADLADTVFLSLLGVALAAGLLSAAFYRWSSSWGVLTLTPYVLSLLRGKPLVGLASQLPFPVQLHLAAALAAPAVVPYTRVAPPLLALFRRAAIGFEAACSAAAAAVGAFVADHNPGRYIWPDED
jgi:nitrate reductase gamma subunit